MGFVHKGQRKVAVVLHLRPSREQIAGTRKARHFASVIDKCRPTAETVDETMLLRRSANKSRQSRRGISLTWLHRIFLWEQGP